jgi:hypothetical protein
LLRTAIQEAKRRGRPVSMTVAGLLLDCCWTVAGD